MFETLFEAPAKTRRFGVLNAVSDTGTLLNFLKTPFNTVFDNYAAAHLDDRQEVGCGLDPCRGCAAGPSREDR